MATLQEAQAKFKAGAQTPANLYEIAYAYAAEKGFDPMVTGDWNQTRLLLQSIAPGQHALISEALGLWMLDSNMMSVAEAAERAGALAGTAPFDTGYLRAEIAAGRLQAHKHGRDWLISKRAFRQWWDSPLRGERGNRKWKATS